MMWPGYKTIWMGSKVGLKNDMTGLHERMDRIEARLPEPPAPAAD